MLSWRFFREQKINQVERRGRNSKFKVPMAERRLTSEKNQKDVGVAGVETSHVEGAPCGQHGNKLSSVLCLQKWCLSAIY
jgi:hypothetical protein